MITWDEAKRRENIRKHKIDFPMISVEDARDSYGELRLQSLGIWRKRAVFLVWTPREDNSAHLISCRYADRKEAEDYFSTF